MTPAAMDRRIAAARRCFQATCVARPTAEVVVEWCDDDGRWHTTVTGTRAIPEATQNAVDVLVDGLALAHRDRTQTVRVAAAARSAGGRHFVAHVVVQPAVRRDNKLLNGGPPAPCGNP